MVIVIFGATGQDSSYLAELLTQQQHTVIGVTRRVSVNTTERLRLVLTDRNYKLVEGDITDTGSVYSIINDYQPDEIYNLAAQSHVRTSFDQPELTFQVNTVGVLNILEGIRRFSPDTRFYQASTSEMFGNNFVIKDNKKMQNEDVEFKPRSPYAVAKLAAHELVSTYRDSYGLFACCGILFNHESERRGENFVTRKITKWLGEFVHWKNCLSSMNMEELKDNRHSHVVMYDPRGDLDMRMFPKLRLGNLNAYRDWGHAEDYVAAMQLMLSADTPKDYVVATGETYSVKDFLVEAFANVNIDDYEPYVMFDENLVRPAEVDHLCGDSTRIRNELGWKPNIDFKTLVKRMVQGDLHEKKKTCCRQATLPQT